MLRVTGTVKDGDHRHNLPFHEEEHLIRGELKGYGTFSGRGRAQEWRPVALGLMIYSQ
jgi:hypothetical protein